MHDCPCCGQPVYGPSGVCDTCANDCDPSTSWHCFTGHCDGSGCTFLGECEGYASAQEYLEVQYITDHPELATDYGREDRAYWDAKYA